MTAADIATGRNPFIGLRVFQEAQAPLFFGREKQIAKLLDRLREMPRFLAIVGSSGCGKSSLVLAGMIPALRQGSIQLAGTRWRIATMRPGAAPIDALAETLAASGVLAGDAPDGAPPQPEIAHALRRGELGLVDLLYQARLRPDENMLLIVDQFEELFTYAGSAEHAAPATDAAAFVKLLLTAAGWTDLPIYVALTMRSDFLGDCARFRELPEAITDGMFLVPRLTRDEIQRTIVEPVHVAGADVTPRLLSRLLNDIGRDSDQLPVLQHALMLTWEAWEKDHADGEKLDVRHYKAIGEMSGALSQHAEKVYANLDPDPERAEHLKQVAEKLFRCLTDRDSENRGVRRPTAFLSMVAVTGAPEGDVAHIVATYSATGVSFLTANAPPPYRDAILDISHEALMRLWWRLREWVDDEADSGSLYRKLVNDATVPNALWINPTLAVGEAWLTANEHTINAAWAARYDDGLKKLPGGETEGQDASRERFGRALAFLAASRTAQLAAAQREADAERKELLERTQRRQRNTVIMIVGVFFVVALGLALFAASQFSAAKAAKDQAREDRIAADERLARVRAEGAYNEARAAYNSALALSAQDKAEPATKAYSNAIDRFTALRTNTDPALSNAELVNDLANAYFGRSTLRAKNGDYAGALEDVNRALAINPQLNGAAAARSEYQARKYNGNAASFQQLAVATVWSPSANPPVVHIIRYSDGGEDKLTEDLRTALIGAGMTVRAIEHHPPTRGRYPDEVRYFYDPDDLAAAEGVAAAVTKFYANRGSPKTLKLLADNPPRKPRHGQIEVRIH
jgi:tetratricopeptide (TPR) repeat protein